MSREEVGYSKIFAGVGGWKCFRKGWDLTRKNGAEK